MMVRLAHLSDIHVTATRFEWRLRDYLNKRLAGWINYRLFGRRFRFRRADLVLRILMQELKERQPDRVIFSGDATALGFESELRRAAELLDVHNRNGFQGLAVPGNHDYATRPAAASGLFEHYFAPWQHGVRVDHHVYPFAQRVGPLWLIGVNSCTGNIWPWDASGAVGREQTERLRRLLDMLEPGPRILVTHYPVCLSNGRREKPWHRLRDLKPFLRVANGSVSLWLHGHRHCAYHLQQSGYTTFPVVCAGSATQMRLWTYNEYTIHGQRCQVVRRKYNHAQRRFEVAEQFEVTLANLPPTVPAASCEMAGPVGDPFPIGTLR